jgi:hypothetical protein
MPAPSKQRPTVSPPATQTLTPPSGQAARPTSGVVLARPSRSWATAMSAPAPGVMIDRIDATTENVDTALLTLSPEFLAALRRVAPKKRRVKIQHVVGLAFLAMMVVLGADKAARELIAARWRRAPAVTAMAPSPATAGPPVVSPVVTTVEPVEHPIVKLVSSPPPLPPGAPAARKMKRRTAPPATPKPARR